MKILLIGAYGYTGKIIADELERNKISFSIAGRDQIKIEELKDKYSSIEKDLTIDLNEAGSINFPLDQFDLFINCAGPFTEESEKFCSALARQKNKIYIDISGEVNFVQRSIETNHEIAKLNNTTIVHACAFESMLTDLSAGILMSKKANPIGLFSFYSFSSSKPSPGTKITMKLSKLRNFSHYQNGKLTPVEQLKIGVILNGQRMAAVPYPLPENMLFQFRYNVKNTGSFLLLSDQEASFVVSSELPVKSASDEYEKIKKFKSAGPNEDERKNQHYVLYTLVKYDDQTLISLQLKGVDMYGATAKITTSVVKKFLSKNSIEKGVISPGEIFKNEEEKFLKEWCEEINFNPDFNLQKFE